MQLQFNIELNNDDELIHKAHGADNGRSVVNRFLLWIPKLTPKHSMYDKFVSSNTMDIHEGIVRSFSANSSNCFFQISASIDNVKRILIYLKNSYRDNNGDRHAENSP